jgi:hypothetical protein
MGTDETRKRIEDLVARIQDEVLESSRRLADAFSREAERSIPATGEDITKLVDEAFEFAQRVIESQRRMVSEVLANMDEALDKAPGQLQQAAKKATAPAKKAIAKKAPAKKAPAPAKKAPAKKKATAKKTPAKKTPAKKTATAKK